MKIYYFLALIIFCSCSTPEEVSTHFPDFSACNCGIEYAPICGQDGNTYLNECLMNCLKTDSTSNGNCPEVFYTASDTLTWPIERVCIPIQTQETAQLVRVLSDGSAVYRRPDGSYFRGNQNLCICLATYTMIATPSGQIPVYKVKEGTLVWTINEMGEKIARPVQKVQKAWVGTEHMMLNIHLKDGRYLQVSSLHPNKEGVPLSNLSNGGSLDGSVVTNIYYTHYQDSITWDLLPAGIRGAYWANDILIGSTMKDWNGNLPF